MKSFVVWNKIKDAVKHSFLWKNPTIQSGSRKIVSTLLKPFKKIKSKEFQTKGMDILCQTASVLNESEFKYFPAFGTLLGLVRDGRIIAHDDDIDFGILITDDFDWSVLIAFLESKGYRLKYWLEHEGKTHEVTLQAPNSSFGIDFFGFTKRGEKLYKYCYLYADDNKAYDDWRMRNVYETIFPSFSSFREIEINKTIIKIPENAEELLVTSYGPNWRIPDPKWSYQKDHQDEMIPNVVGMMKYPDGANDKKRS